jgi:hypothetical protein
MFRSSSLVVVGSLWTLTTFLFVGKLFFPARLLQAAAGPLAAGLILSASLVFLAAVSKSAVLRTTSLQLHFVLPLLWAFQMTDVTDILLGYQGWFLLTLCAFAGAALCERGLQIDELGQLTLAHSLPLQETVTLVQDPRTPWKSGGHVRPALAACDSGGFLRPTLNLQDSGGFRIY